MIDILLLLLKPALRCVDKKEYRFFLHAIVAFICDVVIAHTTWAVMFGWPKKNEWTISHTLERLCSKENSQHPDYQWLVETGLKINRVSPGHIKILLEESNDSV